MYMDEKRYAVLLTETQEVKVLACNPARDMFDIGREAIGCDWIELVEAEPLAKDGLLMMIDEEGKLKPGGALINAAASALYGTERHGDPIVGNAVVVRIWSCSQLRKQSSLRSGWRPSGTRPCRRLPKPLPVVLLIRRNELRPLRPGDSLAGKAIWRDNHGGKGKAAGSAQFQND